MGLKYQTFSYKFMEAKMAQLTLAKRTNLKKVRKQGFRARMATRGGRLVIKRRRAKGRKRLAI